MHECLVDTGRNTPSIVDAGSTIGSTTIQMAVMLAVVANAVAAKNVVANALVDAIMAMHQMITPFVAHDLPASVSPSPATVM